MSYHNTISKIKAMYTLLNSNLKFRNFVLAHLVAGILITVLTLVLIYANTDFLNEKITIRTLHERYTFLFIIDLIPVILGMYAFIVGSKLYKQVNDLNEQLEIQTETINNKALFAQAIGRGEFNTEFEPNDAKDVLGHALVEMRNSLLDANQDEINRNWITSGITEVSEILRQNTELIQLSEVLIAYITKKIAAVQGAFYIVNEEDPNNCFIELKGSYAYNKKKYLKAKFRFAQGLVGQAAIEKDTIIRTEIPEDYVTITSGLLGDRKPKCILLVPLISNDIVYGVIELAGFDRFTDVQIQLVQELSTSIARTIFNVKINEQTLRLLNESQKMSAELSEQSILLIENAQQMKENQDVIERTNKELEVQIHEVNKQQERTHVLLENASEIITIYDEYGVLKYASPSISSILGYNPKEIIGTKETERVHPNGINTVQNIFDELRNYPQKCITAQYSYIKPDKTRTWVETTARSLVNNPSINGILFNIRDITEKRIAEKEQRERAKMQALSENSLDIILRFDLQHNIRYVNPIIEKYTSTKAFDFIDTHIDQLPLNTSIITNWKAILKDVSYHNSHVSREMPFISSSEIQLFVEVNALPEYGVNNELESILFIVHDITLAKEAEFKIKEANLKVQDSINYAKRIQNSILPKEILFKQYFPESFMIFRPKDIVSGDFPFLVKKEQRIYFAAADCTGHGVPGALLSVIGALILNEITTYESPTPAQLLDKLHASMVKTLRQGFEGGENERDGMDVGMCYLNLETGEFAFAGAHRPLYIVRHKSTKTDELEELKGDKFPIGGVQYRGRKEFTNYETVLHKGDRIYVCSDGLPDQFGGPNKEDLKKFGPKKIRQIILENNNKPIGNVNVAIQTALDEWQGNQKQMDDILCIGIEF